MPIRADATRTCMADRRISCGDIGTLRDPTHQWTATKTRYHIEQKPAHLLISADNALFTRYNFLGVWKPYFWPLNANHGTVVRGAGGSDHPHHTGLYLAYGGHGEGGSANIWSDWDERLTDPAGRCYTNALSESLKGTSTLNSSKT